MASTTIVPIQSGLQQQAALVADQQPANAEVPQQQQQHRILRIDVAGTINDPATKWKFTTASGTKEFACCELMVMSPSTKTFHNRTTLDEPISVDTLNAACASDFHGQQAYFFVVRVHAHYLLLQPPRYLCANVGSFPPSSTIRAAARYLGEDLLWFAFKSYSGALEGGMTQIYRSKTPPNETVVHQSNKQLVRSISSAGLLVAYTGTVDPAFYTPPPQMSEAPMVVPPRQAVPAAPTTTQTSSAPTTTVMPTAMLPPPSQTPLMRKQRALSNKQRRAALLVTDASAAAAKQIRREKKAQAFRGSSKTVNAQRMMLVNSMPLDLEVNSDMIKRICGLGDPDRVTFNLSLTAAECAAYTETIMCVPTVGSDRIETQLQNGDKIEFDLSGLQTSANDIRVSVPASWVPTPVQQEMTDKPLVKKAIEIEMARVVRARVDTRSIFVPEHNDSLDAVLCDTPPQIGYKTYNGNVGVALVNANVSVDGGATATKRTRALVALQPIAAQQSFMLCSEARVINYTEIIGLQLGTMLFGNSKTEALPSNFAIASHPSDDEHRQFIVQFGAINDTVLEDGSLIVFASQCAAAASCNARLDITSFLTGDGKQCSVRLIALTDIKVGETICIDRGDWIVEQFYPFLTGRKMPRLCTEQQQQVGIESSSSSSSPTSLFDTLAAVATQQSASEYVDEEVILQSSASHTVVVPSTATASTTATSTTATSTTTTASTTLEVPLANDLNDDDDDNDLHETNELTLRAKENADRLAALSIIENDLRSTASIGSIGFVGIGIKRHHKYNNDDDDNDDDDDELASSQRVKARRYNFMLDTRHSTSRASTPAGTPKQPSLSRKAASKYFSKDNTVDSELQSCKMAFDDNNIEISNVFCQ